MLQKVDLIIRAIRKNPGKVFVHFDVDIQFFKPTKQIILKLIKNKDVVIQHESLYGTVYSGIIAMRGNERNLKLWEDIKNQFIAQTKKHD